MLKEGSKAPDFTLTGTDGKSYSLSDFKGRNVVLYFYPRDDTPGCTIEAKGFNESLDEMRRLGAEIIGVSKDDVDSHKRFCEKYSLKFLLLSDPESKVIKMYGAYGDRGVFGQGTLRKTFIINKEGKVALIFERVKALGHNKEVLAALGRIS